jgi:hypothetical protein
MLFLRTFPEVLDTEIKELLANEEHDGEFVPDTTGWKLFKNFNFQFILWSKILSDSDFVDRLCDLLQTTIHKEKTSKLDRH